MAPVQRPCAPHSLRLPAGWAVIVLVAYRHEAGTGAWLKLTRTSLTIMQHLRRLRHYGLGTYVAWVVIGGAIALLAAFALGPG